MNNGFFARSFERNSKENPVIKKPFLLTDKPMIYVANIDNRLKIQSCFKAKTIAKNKSSLIKINGKLESEMAEFDEEEKINS